MMFIICGEPLHTYLPICVLHLSFCFVPRNPRYPPEFHQAWGRARILAAACSATIRMAAVGLLVM